MSHFCLTLKLETERYQEDRLNKRFEIARNIYNSLVTVTQKRYKEMVKTKKFRKIKAELIDLYDTTDQIKIKRKKKWLKELNEMYKEYRLGEYSFHDDVQTLIISIQMERIKKEFVLLGNVPIAISKREKS